MERETSCINSRAILDYLRANHNGDWIGILEDLDPEIDAMPDPVAYLSDPNNWISCEVCSTLFARVRTFLDDPAAAFKIARYAAENTSLGYAQRIVVKSFWSVKKLLKNIQKLNDKWNRNKRVELVDIEGSRAVVRLHWDEKMKSSKDICMYNQGAYTFLPLVWGGKPLNIEETCCFFDNAPYCEYHIKWPARNRLYELFSRVFATRSVLMDTIREMEADKQIIEQKYAEVNHLNAELNQRIKQLVAVQDTGKAILSTLELEKLLAVIMSLLSNACQINRALIMLVNDESRCLEYTHGVGFDGKIPDAVQNYCIPLDRLNNILARVASSGQSEYVPQVDRSILRKDNIMLTHGKPTSVFVVPLITRGKVIGVIATDSPNGQGVTKETRQMLEIFAPQIAIGIENARMYQTLEKQMAELRRSYALLSRAEKFSLLGNLAARLAHEIKNPMTAIQTFIQMLPRKYDDEDFRNNFYEIAREETARVNNLITELLDLVKARESHFEFDDLHGLIDKMVMLLSPQSNAKKIRIDCRYDQRLTKVWMDTEKMKQVILNLLSNAIDFTPQKGEISVETYLKSGPGAKSWVIVMITDSGPGIPESMAASVFDPYFTTKHKSDIHNGTGLGLFIAHQNMQDHGGAIEVNTQVVQGASFTLTLPAKPA